MPDHRYLNIKYQILKITSEKFMLIFAFAAKADNSKFSSMHVYLLHVYLDQHVTKILELS